MGDTGLAQGLGDPSGRQAPVTSPGHQEHEEGMLHLWVEVRKKPNQTVSWMHEEEVTGPETCLSY